MRRRVLPRGAGRGGGVRLPPEKWSTGSEPDYYGRPPGATGGRGTAGPGRVVERPPRGGQVEQGDEKSQDGVECYGADGVADGEPASGPPADEPGARDAADVGVGESVEAVDEPTWEEPASDGEWSDADGGDTEVEGFDAPWEDALAGEWMGIAGSGVGVGGEVALAAGTVEEGVVGGSASWPGGVGLGAEGWESVSDQETGQEFGEQQLLEQEAAGGSGLVGGGGW